jgi:hypothetical protein
MEREDTPSKLELRVPDVETGKKKREHHGLVVIEIATI